METDKPQRSRASFSKLVRRTHMFMALFLTPWILMYAVSTIVMHHRLEFTGQERRVEPPFKTIQSGSGYRVPLDVSSSPREIALQILKDHDLEGAFTVRGDIETGRLNIFRDRPVGSYRITYDHGSSFLLIERQEFGLAYCLEMLHRRRGYDHGYTANNLWALIVDSVIVAIVLWSLTGLWMWAEMSRTRKLGLVCLASGLTLFGVLLCLL